MPKLRKRGEKSKSQLEPQTLKGWKQISEFLGEPASVVKRWASKGMPVHREGQLVSTSSNELNSWLGQESGKPVDVATETTDLTAELKRGLSFIRRQKRTYRTRNNRHNWGNQNRRWARKRRASSQTPIPLEGAPQKKAGGTTEEGRNLAILSNFNRTPSTSKNDALPAEHAQIAEHRSRDRQQVN